MIKVKLRTSFCKRFLEIVQLGSLTYLESSLLFLLVSSSFLVSEVRLLNYLYFLFTLRTKVEKPHFNLQRILLVHQDDSQIMA